MKNSRLFKMGWLAVCLAMMGSGVGSAAAAAVGQSVTEYRRVRVVTWYPHLAIADRLLPDDEIVELDSPFSEQLLNQVVLSRAEMIASLTKRALLVAIADVTSVTGELDVDRTRPQTRLAAFVREILQRSTQYAVGDARPFPLNAVIYRGSVRVGSVIVRMGLRSDDVDSLPPGRYVLFLESDGAGGLSVFHPPLLVTSGRLTYPWGYRFPPQKPNPFDGMTVEELSEAVRGAERNTGPLGLVDHVGVNMK